MTNQTDLYFNQLPLQHLGGHWHLAGSLQSVEAHGNGELTVVRKIDALSPQISVAKSCQYVIPKVTITTPTGGQVHLQNAKVTEQTDTNEVEDIEIVFQKIVFTYLGGGIGSADDWATGSGGHKHKK